MFKSKQTTWRTPFGIVNGQGKPWTTRVFWGEDEARAYLKEKGTNPYLKLGNHRIVLVSVTIRTVKP